MLPLWPLKGKKRREKEHSLYLRTVQQMEQQTTMRRDFLHCRVLWDLVLRSCTDSVVASHYLVYYLPMWKMRSITSYLPTTCCHLGTMYVPVTVLVLCCRKGDGTIACAWDRCIGKLQQSCEAGKISKVIILTWELCKVFTKTLLNVRRRGETEGKLFSKFFSSTLHTLFF